ncbi:MAG: ATPase, T2SS/T4P/T4SS family [Planctomycetota bacterium]|nr:ATPase, T2SS/T4P/T4SS family [Planctomycetota bacterium]
MATINKNRVRLGDLMIQRGALTQEQLARALETQQQSQQQRLIGEILVDLGYATKEQVLSAVTESSGLPYARLVPQLVDQSVRSALPESFLQKHGVLPLFRIRDMLTVATSEPSNLFLLDEIAHVAGLSVQLVAATPENIYQMIEYAAAEGKDQPPAEETSPEHFFATDMALPDDYDTAYGTWPPDKVMSLLVREAVRSRASAIHLEPDEKMLRVRFCIDGALRVVMRPPARLAAGLTGALEEMMGCAAHGTSGGESRLSARLLVQGKAVQVHLTALGTAFGPRVTVCLVRDDEAQRPLEKLGCDFELLARYHEMIAPLRGLVVVAGPRASGTTTTLYSSLNALDPIRLNLCTFESSINFNIPGVSQFSPSTCGAPDVEAALGRLLLQRPDVLVLDCEFSDAALVMAAEAARDGGLVLVRLRAGDAADAIARLAARVPADVLAVALRGVLAQRLVRTICPHCRITYEPPPNVKRQVAEKYGPVEAYVKGRGCSYCTRTGLVGQIGLFELAPMDAGLAPHLEQPMGHAEWRAAIRAAGYPSLWVDGINKVRAGITSLDEVAAVLSGCPDGPAQPAAGRVRSAAANPN